MAREPGLEPLGQHRARGFAALGLELFTSPDCRAETLSVPLYPAGIDDVRFRSAVARRGVVLAGALGPLAGRAFRVGHMGNIGTEEVERTLRAIGEGLREAGSKSLSAG